MYTQGEVILMFLTILLYFCTSILTLLNFIKYCSFKAQTNGMCIISRHLFIHFVGEIILMFLTILLYFCTSILTLLYFIEYCIFKAQTKAMRSVSSYSSKFTVLNKNSEGEYRSTEV